MNKCKVIKKLKFFARFCVFTAIAIALVSISHAAFLNPGTRVLMGNSDTRFNLCNRSGETLRIALIYQHHWKFGEEPTWPAKGWFEYAPNECVTIAVNGLYGVMAVVKVNENGKMEPFYSGSTSIKDLQVNFNEAKIFAAVHLCLGDAPFDEYRDSIADYKKCKKGQTKIPFNVMFSQGGRENFTLSLQ